MNYQDKSFSGRAYRLLLRLFPFEFRGDFGSEMEGVFRDQRAEASRMRGGAGMLGLWWETVLGVLREAPKEHLAILRQDTRFALRAMAKDPGHVAVTALILALGIGANAAVFSALNAVLARPLPFAHGEELLRIHQRAPKAETPEMEFSAPEIEDYRARNRTLEEVVEYHTMVFTLLGQGEAERVRTGVVSARFFSALGARPALGRDFLPADERPGARPSLLLSHEYWRRRGGDPEIVGKVFRMNDRDHVVIGVLPPMPQFPRENDVFVTTAACPSRSNPNFAANRMGRMMNLFGRLKPGVTPGQAQADLSRIAGELAREHPEAYPPGNGYEVVAVPLKDEITRGARPTLWLLMGAASFVFLIACANVANLTLSRMVGREREMQLRSALGASGGRLFRQLATESLIVAGLAAALGLALAAGGMELLRELMSRMTPRAREISLDWPAFFFALAGAAVVSVAFGSLAAFHSRKRRGADSPFWRSRRLPLQPAFVICQVAFSFVLLIGAGLLTRSLMNLRRVDPGFERQNVVAAGVHLICPRYTTAGDWRGVTARLLEKLREQPETDIAAVSSGFPLDPDAATYGAWNGRFDIDGGPSGVTAAMRVVTPGYFDTLGVPILDGREFGEADDQHAPAVAIVSQSFARRSWGAARAVGKTLTLGDGGRVTVIGVAGDVKEFGLNRETPDEIYGPAAQRPEFVSAVLIRSAGDPVVAATAVRRAIREADPEIAITRVETLSQASNDSLALHRMTARLIALFAVLALVIAVFGVGAALSLSVRRRANEIAVRLAMGARASTVLGSLMRQGMIQVAIGVILGWAGASLLTGSLRGLLFEVAPTDPTTFLGTTFALVVAGLLACYAPAARAVRVDPLRVLKSE